MIATKKLNLRARKKKESDSSNLVTETASESKGKIGYHKTDIESHSGSVHVKSGVHRSDTHSDESGETLRETTSPKQCTIRSISHGTKSTDLVAPDSKFNVSTSESSMNVKPDSDSSYSKYPNPITSGKKKSSEVSIAVDHRMRTK